MKLDLIVQASLRVIDSLKELTDPFERASKSLIDSLESGGKVLICGNGGSAADAMHFATELVCRFVADRRHLPAICLNSSCSDLTAMANDFSYEEIFARQCAAFASPGDVLVVLSTSGNSRNVVRALEESRKNGMNSIALLGRDGGDCRGKATVELIVNSDSTARIQEAHKVLIHAFCEGVDEAFTSTE